MVQIKPLVSPSLCYQQTSVQVADTFHSCHANFLLYIVFAVLLLRISYVRTWIPINPMDGVFIACALRSFLN